MHNGVSRQAFCLLSALSAPSIDLRLFFALARLLLPERRHKKMKKEKKVGMG